MSYRSLRLAIFAFVSIVLSGCGATTSAARTSDAQVPTDDRAAKGGCEVERFRERVSPYFEPCQDEANVAHLEEETGRAPTETHVAVTGTGNSCGKYCRFGAALHAQERASGRNGAVRAPAGDPIR
jgi:hypothetical protein